MIRVTLALFALLVMAACTPDDQVGEGTPPPGDFLVPVTLTEHEIDMPDSAPAGELTFQLNNDGQQAHSFVIEGEGVREQPDVEVQPGQTQNFTVELEVGTYTVWCPIADHRDRGMEVQFDVVESPQADDPAGQGVEPTEQEEISD